MESQLLQGKIALVVGGGQIPGEDTGNGRAVAQVFSQNGAAIAVVDRNLDSAQETVDLIAASGGEAFAIRADVTSESDVIEAIQACLDRYGRIDILHDNVGIADTGIQLAELEIARFDEIVAINLRGMVLVCRHTLPIMRTQEKGVIITISSNAAYTNHPSASYRISKSAIITMTKHIAITNARFGIRANTLLPGLLQTPMAIERRVAQSGVTREDVLSLRASKVPLTGAVGTAWDVANAALFLASDLAQFITGAELVIDGGQSLQVQA